MIHHTSMSAKNPEKVAKVLAELMKGDYTSFPIFDGAYIAFANDSQGTAIEVQAFGSELVPNKNDFDAESRINSSASEYTEAHIAMDTSLDVNQVLEIAKREGWRAFLCARGPVYKVIEFWIENRFLIELITPEYQNSYTQFMSSSKNWRELFKLA
jgi:hypothetical protein